jgi:xanthine/uracil permease
MDYILDFAKFYIGVGFVLNTALSLINFYRASKEGYIVLPHPMIYFLTIFSWPKTLYDLVVSFGKDNE